MVKIPTISAKQIVEAVNGTVVFDKSAPDARFDHLAEPQEAGSNGIAFVISEGFVKDAAATQASVIVTQAAFAEKVRALLPDNVKTLIAAADAYLGLAELSRVIAELDPLGDWKPGQETKMIAPSAKVDPSAKLGPGVCVGDGAQIGPRTVLLANVTVGPGVKIGADCVLFPGVVVYPRAQIGERVRLHANVVIGSDGFGYARGPRGSVKIWHLGRVVIGDDVEIGAGTMIDRGTMKDTIIEKGAKIDNLCQVGHNGHIKAHAILCAQVGMAGNVTIGQGAILAGKVGVADKLEIGDGALVGPMSGLSKDVPAGAQVMGQQPAKPRREWWKLIALFERLPDLFDRVKKLEAKDKNG